MNPGMISIGVDTGGTHTDIVLSGNGKLFTLKVPSTPEDLCVGIINGVKQAAKLANVSFKSVERIVYASTYVTNLFIEGKNGNIGLITTEGFRDVLEIGRASRKPDVYDIHWRPVPPLVPRHLRFGVSERINHLGEIIDPLDENNVTECIEKLSQLGVESIAVCLLHSYANPIHEKRIAEIANKLYPSIDISISSEVVREFREYERTSTTCVSAYIRKSIVAHLNKLKLALLAEGITATPFIMQGNGGISTFDSVSNAPTSVTHSGVMGGIVGAAALGLKAGVENLITLDMGGTSADFSLIANGTPTLTSRSKIGDHPLLVPTLDMITIGAGGGSIAWVDGGVALRVGPRSAGAVPGPSCYGLGGLEATVTDANLVVGRINSDYFLGGARPLDLSLALKAIERNIAIPLEMSPEQAALGIIAVAEAHMVNAIRLVSVDRGLDPRDFVLVAFGGAGALHAARLAEALSIREVLIPPAPGNLSAMGLLCANVRHDHARTLVANLNLNVIGSIKLIIDELLLDAKIALSNDRVLPENQSTSLSIDLRYEGQNYELTLPVDINNLTLEFSTLPSRFNEKHLLIYGYQLKGREVQIINVRVTAIGKTIHTDWPEFNAKALLPPKSIAKRSLLISEGERVDAYFFRFDDLLPDHEILGPAIIEYSGSTLFVPPNWKVKFDSMMNTRMNYLIPI